MGEVYRAKDTKLGREVAIKLLLEEVSQDPERMARFEREARVLASLNHNNIATLYGFESEGDTSFLLMEVVEGETLADRIKRGPMPVDEALLLFVQIAEGLERQGRCAERSTRAAPSQQPAVRSHSSASPVPPPPELLRARSFR